MIMEQTLASLQLGEGNDRIKALFHGLVDTVFDKQLQAATRQQARDEDDTRRLARAIYVSRQQRGKFLPAEMLGEPAWDILLDLYSMQLTHEEGTSTKSACSAANVPYSTAWRMLALLEDAGLVERCNNAQDKRLSLVRLTERGEEAVRRCLTSMAASLA